MTNLFPLTADCFLGPCTDANAAEFVAITAIFDRIKALPPLRFPNPSLCIQDLYAEQYRRIAPVLALNPELKGWRMASESECEKLYIIDGQQCWAFAYLDSYVRKGILTIEFAWPNSNNFQTRLRCSSLLDGAKLLGAQIAILRESEQA
ncbi:hypothetical protein IPU75_08460 [Ochrobactrum sp. SD129]|nr:hypothetical protein [Ochrobactrum sp. SD129]